MRQDYSSVQKDSQTDAIRGCLIGGAAGDALGYTIEFMDEESIFSQYGERGITEYKKSAGGKALISDDTQMTLFTAVGLLHGATRGALRGIAAAPRHYVAPAYLDWLKTQNSTIEKVRADRARERDRSSVVSRAGAPTVSWLLDVPEFYARRAPGNTCLSALRSWKHRDDYIADKVNSSKGCGGIMRVAPMGLFPWLSIEDLDLEGAQLAAITHGHPLGYMTAAVLVHIITRIVRTPAKEALSLKEIVLEARDTMTRLFAGEKHLGELTEIIDLAVELSENDRPDLENIHRLGEGWVAEETLGISLYCALKYQRDFSAGIIAAVNHKGDSDSTGAVTGNILGALLGYSAIEEKWKQGLELSDVILEVAGDLARVDALDMYHVEPEWEEKYVKIHRFRI